MIGIGNGIASFAKWRRINQKPHEETTMALVKCRNCGFEKDVTLTLPLTLVQLMGTITILLGLVCGWFLGLIVAKMCLPSLSRFISHHITQFMFYGFFAVGAVGGIYGGYYGGVFLIFYIPMILKRALARCFKCPECGNRNWSRVPGDSGK